MPGTQLATDNFTRANENPLSNSGKWTQVSGAGTMQVVSNLCEPAATSTVCANYWNALVWPNDQYAEVTAETTTSAGFSPGLLAVVRAQSAANSFYYAYIVCGVGDAQISKSVAGTDTTLVSGTIALVTAGDVFRLVVSGTLLTLLQNGTQVLQFSGDSTFASGSAGIGGFAGVVSNCQTPLWAGGTAIISTPVATPAAGTYSSAQTVSLSSDSGSTITYTTDGSTPIPGSHGTVYSTPFSVSATATVKAVSASTNYTNSTQFSGLYTINNPTPGTAWSQPDCRQAVPGFGPGPNSGVTVNGTVQYTGQTSSNPAVPGVDSRTVKPVGCGNPPQNSRTPQV